jgi:integrase
MGTISSTKAGYLYFDFYYQGYRCREHTELKNTPENQKLMKEALSKIEGEIRLGTFSYRKYFPGSKLADKFKDETQPKASLLFEEYTNTWYKNNKISWKPSVQRDFRSTLDGHLIPHFKDKPVSEITKWMIKEFRTGLSELGGRKDEKMSNKRINNIIQLLRLIINEAAEEHDFSTPFLNLKPLAVTKPDIMPLSLDEVFLFLKHVQESFHDYYIVRFFTGMRTAEIDGLKWKYVDFKSRKILVRTTWQRNQWVTPKTQSSVRDIDMMKIVEEALLKQKAITGDGEMVFRTKKGNPLEHGNVSKRVWYPTLLKAGLAERTPYQTRHTAATLWLASGENPEWVARQLGHSNTEMLFKVYSKFIPNLTRRDGSAFEKVISEKIVEEKSKINPQEEKETDDEK